MTPDPWTFGWTQLLTLAGLLLTFGIAVFGFRSFERWRREQLEQKKIDVALEALGLAYESRYIFKSIRSPMSYSYESKDMPRWPGETDERWNARAPFYAILARINQNKEFFERLFKLQPKFMALFGEETEAQFMKIHQARRYIEVSAGMLMRTVNDGREWSENRQRQQDQWECDVWEGTDEVVEGVPNCRRVSDHLRAFQEGMRTICLPIAAHRERLGLGYFFCWNVREDGTRA